MEQFRRTAVALLCILSTFKAHGDNDIVVTRQGAKAILPCGDLKHLNDVTSLSWIRTSGSTPIVVFTKYEEGDPFLPRPDKYSVSYFYQLEILNVNASDAGSYRCQYRKSADVIFRMIELYVPAVFIEECTDVCESKCRVDGSYNDSLTCTFSGFPANITVSWQRTSGDEEVLVERSFRSSGELVTTYKERENTSLVRRVTDGSGGNSGRYAPFEQAVQILVPAKNAGNTDIPGNNINSTNNTQVIVMGVINVFLIIIITTGIIFIRWKRKGAIKRSPDYSLVNTDQEPGMPKPTRVGPEKEWKLKTDVALSTPDTMDCMAATPDGMMAVGCHKGKRGIEIYSVDGQLQQRVLKGVTVRGIAFLSDDRCAVLHTGKTNEKILNVSLYSQGWKKVDVWFETLSWNEDGLGDLNVESDNDVRHRKAEKVKVDTEAGEMTDKGKKYDLHGIHQAHLMESFKTSLDLGELGALTVASGMPVREKGRDFPGPHQAYLMQSFETPSLDVGGLDALTVDSDNHIYVSYKKAEKIQVFTPAGGEPVREITCHGYGPQQIFAMQSSGMMIVKYFNYSAWLINEWENTQRKVIAAGRCSFVCPYVCKDDTILIAIVNKKHRVTIQSYKHGKNKLQHMETLVTLHEIQRTGRDWYYLQEFTSGEIAFCTTDRLYIFSNSMTADSV